MKKIYVLALLCIPLCLTMGFIIPTWTDGEQEQEAPIVPYDFESGYYSVQEMGKLLERFGKEIQQDGSMTIGGRTYPMTGFAGVEMSVGSNGFTIDVFSANSTEPPGEDYEAYKRSPLGDGGTTAVAEFLAKVGEDLASSGNIVHEDYSVAFEGTATVTLRVVREVTSRFQRAQFSLHIAFGEGDLLRPEDEEDLQEKVERGESTVLALQEFTEVNQERLARLFASLSSDLRDDRVSELAAGEITKSEFSHVITTDGQSHRISISFEFGPPRPTQQQSQQPQPDQPRYAKESVGYIPIIEIGQILKRIGTEMMESDSLTFDSVAYRIGRSGSYEINMRHNRLVLEVSTTNFPPTPPKK